MWEVKSKILIKGGVGKTPLFILGGIIMKKFMLGSLFTLLFNYCLGSTFILYKSISRKDNDLK